MNTAIWHSAHVFHHAPDGTDELLLTGVRPLLASFDNEGFPAYFQRHWAKGPHVRINVRASRRSWDQRLRPMIDEAMGAYLSDHPSQGHPDPEHEMRAHEELARLEEEHGPLFPWHPDNSIHYADFDRRLHVLGTPEASDLLARFHADTTELAFAIMEDARGGARLERLFTLMLATAGEACPPITKGAISYRSHTEGFLANVSRPGAIRDRFQQIHQTNRQALAERLHEVLRGLESGEHRLPHLAEWVALVREYKRRLEGLEAEGLLVLPRVGLPMQSTGQWSRVSPFHKALFGNEEIRKELDESSWFTVYRALLNYQYLFFGRVGVIPRERFLLCYLAARTVELEFDVEVPEMLGLGITP
ncbi:thiopeptide maturation pyridine synthase [Spongiactinospora sp. TRM90649]|uniref:thiopeptide maturation pyridine synthase n=1 Tax=Spongiactinospora sp. TRM90649 TaxID=3031114 RepID=UPI0023F7C7E0|nr:thiopeptide maturation pyridine synthase [Spongiactinospora sp. TRM90649]MDF5756345.1 lantibiotic dehydratase C-terminal domain-containing protein [Spongiactinospora sp. TRM90649]